MYLVELGPCPRRDRAAAAVAAIVARTFAPKRAPQPPADVEALARRRPGLIRFTRPQ